MASLIVLKGNGVELDLTRNIPTPEYAVQEIKNFVSWIDGNYSVRRHITDTKVQGTFRLKFPTKEDYLRFVDFVKKNEDPVDGALLCDVYCNNRDIVKRVHAFLDYDPQNELPLMGGMDYEGFDVTIEERGEI